MGRDRGPVERLSRREGVELELKGVRRRRQPSTFGLQLRAKQVLKRLYGVRERRFVSHGHVFVNGRRVTIPSYRVRPGEVIGVHASSPVRTTAAESVELLARVAPWLETDPDGLVGRVLRNPERADISVPVDEQLVVEHFSRR